METYEEEEVDPLAADSPTEVKEDENMKVVIQALIDFDQPIEDIETLGEALKDISIYCNESTEFILQHQLFSQTSLIDHFISLISDPSIPPTLKVLSINSISAFIPYFNEEQVNGFLELPFFHEIFEIYFYFLERSQNSVDGICLAKILQFFSNMALSTIQARDEIISQYPIQGDFETLESKVIEMINQIGQIIVYGDFKTQIPYFLLFFKSLCYHTLNQNAYEVACVISLNLTKQLSRENYEYLFKILWYICKNGFSEIVASKAAFFDILLNLSFFRNVSLTTLKCFSKIIKSMSNFNLSKYLNFKLYVDCIAELNIERSIIILDLIEFLITINTDESESLIDAKSNELKNVYLSCFLVNQLLFQLKKVIASDSFTMKHKIISFRILKIIVFKDFQPYIHEVVKKKFIKPMLYILELHDLILSESVVSILLFIINSCINNEFIVSIISQIREANGYQSILILINDIDETDDSLRKQNPIFEEIYKMAKEIIDLIDKIEEERIANQKDLSVTNEEEETNEKESAWITGIDGIVEKILKNDDEEEEEVKEEVKRPKFLNDLESIFISIPIDDEVDELMSTNENMNKTDEEELSRSNEVKWLKSREILASILDDYKRNDLVEEEEEESNS